MNTAQRRRARALPVMSSTSRCRIDKPAVRPENDSRGDFLACERARRSPPECGLPGNSSRENVASANSRGSNEAERRSVRAYRLRGMVRASTRYLSTMMRRSNATTRSATVRKKCTVSNFASRFADVKQSATIPFRRVFRSLYACSKKKMCKNYCPFNFPGRKFPKYSLNSEKIIQSYPIG